MQINSPLPNYLKEFRDCLSDIGCLPGKHHVVIYFLIRCAQSKITLFMFCIIESGQETKDTQFVVSVVILSRVTSRVVMSDLQVFI